jgi:predicted DNA-binding transcriptional regulator YafY
MLLRQWRLVLALSESRMGLTIPELGERTGCSRSTVYRDLSLLAEAGAPIASHVVGGIARQRLLRPAELPSVGLNALQIAALHLARAELEPIAGTSLVAELDSLLAKLRPPERQTSFRFATHAAGQPGIVGAIERARERSLRARIEYRAASRGGRPSIIHIEPLLLNVAGSEPYVRAYCVERQAERTYKVRRIVRVDLTDERASYRPADAPENAFRHSVKAWTGDLTTVRVRLDSEAAWLASEYPLVADQNTRPAERGAVIVEAQVSGVIEAARWVLSWGGSAEALEPPSLRETVRAEVARALQKYDGPGPAKAARRKSTNGEPGRLTRRGTAGA